MTAKELVKSWRPFAEQPKEMDRALMLVMHDKRPLPFWTKLTDALTFIRERAQEAKSDVE